MIENFNRLFCPVLVMLVLTACATRPNIDYDQAFDFDSIKSFRVVKPEADSTTDMRVAGH